MKRNVKHFRTYRNIIMLAVCLWIVFLTIAAVAGLKPVTEQRMADATNQLAYYTSLSETADESELTWINGRIDTLESRLEMLPHRESFYVLCMLLILGFSAAGLIYQMVCDTYFTGAFGALCILLSVGVTFRAIIGCEKEDVIYLALALAILVVIYFLSRECTRLNLHNHSIHSERDFKNGASLASLIVYVFCAAVAVISIVLYFTHGIEENGAFIRVQIGTVAFQPSEFIKIALILMGALSYKKTGRTIGYFALCLLTCIMLYKQHDLGTMLIVLSMALAMILLLVDNMKVFFLVVFILLVAGVVVGLWAGFDYVVARFSTVWKAMSSEYSTQQADLLRSMVFGGIFGLGFENSSYLINIFGIDNDMAIAGITAVFGFGMLTIVMLCYLITVLLPLTNTATSSIAYFIITQSAVLLTVQVLLNFLGSVNVIPFTGVVAPFLSEGGTALCTFCGLFGLIFGSLNQNFGKIKEGSRT